MLPNTPLAVTIDGALRIPAKALHPALRWRLAQDFDLAPDSEELVLPRGARASLEHAADIEGIRLVWRDLRIHFKPRATLPLRKAHRSLLKLEQGYWVDPTLDPRQAEVLLGATGQPALVVVAGPERAALWAGRLPVWTAQALSGLAPEHQVRLGREFGAILLEGLEALPGALFSEVLPRIPARYRFGVAADPRWALRHRFVDALAIAPGVP